MSGAGEVYPGITVDPAIVHGRLVLAGTRVPVAVVLHQIAGGQSFESVCASYDLTAEQMRAAIGYGASLVTDDEIWSTSQHDRATTWRLLVDENRPRSLAPALGAAGSVAADARDAHDGSVWIDARRCDLAPLRRQRCGVQTKQTPAQHQRLRGHRSPGLQVR